MNFTDALKEWFFNLSRRDQRAVLIGGGAFFLFLVYVLVWSPIRALHEEKQKALRDQTDLLIYVREAEAKLAGMDNTALRKEKVNTPLELITFLKSKLDDFSLNGSLPQIRQSGDDAVTISFKNVVFDEVLKFLIAVQNAKQVDIRLFSATSVSDQGRVNAEVSINLT